MPSESQVREGLDRQAQAEVKDMERLGHSTTHEKQRRELAKIMEREDRKRSEQKRK